MGRKAVIALGALALCVPLTGATSANAVQCPLAGTCPPWPGNVQASMAARVAPTALPRTDYAPVTWTVSGKFGTANGAHPPALREVLLDIDKDVKVNTMGYPVCKAGRRQLDNRDPAGAMRACADSVLGRGLVNFEIAFPGQEPLPVQGPLTIFNRGEKRGEIKLYLHSFITVPVPTAVVTVVTITRKGSGIRSVAKVPVVAGGSGSVVGFHFKLGKTFSYGDRKVGFVEARCPDGVFKVSIAKLLFRNEAKTPGEGASTQLRGSLAVPCSGKG